MDDLMKAAQSGDINALYKSIRLEQNILEGINGIHFVNTPLHIAAAAGHTHFSIEIISLMPSFARKLNPDGLSPLDLALQNGHSETVKRLVKLDRDLIRVQGRERLTPLHYVAKTNDINLLSEFLCACPESIKDLTIRDETVLHIAVRNSCLEAFKILLEWLRRTHNRRLLNWIDEEGNTVLHIAVSTNQPQIVKLLINNSPMIKNVKNLQGLAALDIALNLDADLTNTEEVMNILRRAKAAKAASLPNERSLADYLISPEQTLEYHFRNVLYWKRDLTMEMRNVVLVVAVLIATATFQAVLSPPGGGLPGDKNAPTKSNYISSSLTEVFFVWFYVLNTLAFIASIMVIIIVLQLRPYSWLLHLSLVFLGLGYGCSLFHLLTWPLAACLMILSFAISALGYGSKFIFSVMEVHATSAFGVLLLPDSQSRLLKQRLELIHRLVD